MHSGTIVVIMGFKVLFANSDRGAVIFMEEDSTSNVKYPCLQPLSSNAVTFSYSGNVQDVFFNQFGNTSFQSYVGIPTGEVFSGYKYNELFYSGGLPWIINTGLYHINRTIIPTSNENYWQQLYYPLPIAVLTHEGSELYIGNFWYNLSNWYYKFNFKAGKGAQYCLPCGLVETECNFNSTPILIYSRNTNVTNSTHSFFDETNNHIYYGAYGINYNVNVNSFINQVRQPDGSIVDLRTNNLNTNPQFIRISLNDRKYDDTWNNLNGAKFLVNTDYMYINPVVIPIENNSYYVALAFGHPDIDAGTIVFQGSDGATINQRLVVVNPDGTINYTLSAPFSDVAMDFNPNLDFFGIYTFDNSYPHAVVKMSDDRTLLIYSFMQNMSQREARDLVSVNIITGQKKHARIFFAGGIRGGANGRLTMAFRAFRQRNYAFLSSNVTSTTAPINGELELYNENVSIYSDPNSLGIFTSKTPVRVFTTTNCVVVSILLDEEEGYAYFGLQENRLSHTGMSFDGVNCYMIARMNISDSNPANWFVDTFGFDTLTNSIQRLNTDDDDPAACFLLGLDSNHLYVSFDGAGVGLNFPVETFNGMLLSYERGEIVKIRKSDGVILRKDTINDNMSFFKQNFDIFHSG
jgi:hypothetical protein